MANISNVKNPDIENVIDEIIKRVQGSNVQHDVIQAGFKNNIKKSIARIPLILLFDTSASMYGAPICCVNNGLLSFKSQMESEIIDLMRSDFGVDICVIEYNTYANIVSSFCAFEDWKVPQLKACGSTYLWDGLLIALQNMITQMDQYYKHGIQPLCPRIVVFAEGLSVDSGINKSEVQKLMSHHVDSFLYYNLKNGELSCKKQNWPIQKLTRLYPVIVLNNTGPAEESALIHELFSLGGEPDYNIPAFDYTSIDKAFERLVYSISKEISIESYGMGAYWIKEP